jgi:hypothetical protein
MSAQKDAKQIKFWFVLVKSKPYMTLKLNFLRKGYYKKFVHNIKIKIYNFDLKHVLILVSVDCFEQ